MAGRPKLFSDVHRFPTVGRSAHVRLYDVGRCCSRVWRPTTIAWLCELVRDACARDFRMCCSEGIRNILDSAFRISRNLGHTTLATEARHQCYCCVAPGSEAAASSHNNNDKLNMMRCGRNGGEGLFVSFMFVSSATIHRHMGLCVNPAPFVASHVRSRCPVGRDAGLASGVPECLCTCSAQCPLRPRVGWCTQFRRAPCIACGLAGYAQPRSPFLWRFGRGGQASVAHC